MKKEVTTVYVCELCGRPYGEENKATSCEKGHVTRDKLTIVGEEYEPRYEMPQTLIVERQISKRKKEEYYYEYHGKKGKKDSDEWDEDETPRKKKR